MFIRYVKLIEWGLRVIIRNTLIRVMSLETYKRLKCTLNCLQLVFTFSYFKCKLLLIVYDVQTGLWELTL